MTPFAQHAMARIFLVAFCGILLINCNYVGNPYRSPMTPRSVSVQNDIRVDPGNWWTGIKHNSVEIRVYREGLAAYTVKLGPVKGIKLRKVEKGEGPDNLVITLDISASAQPQTVPIIFTKGTNTVTLPYQILAGSASATEWRHHHH
jgi:Cyclomaltodextrinase, N-terminal